MKLSSPFVKKRFVFRNLAFWAILYTLFMIAQYLSRGGNDPSYRPYRDTTLTLGSAMFIFYANFYLCDALFVRRKFLYFVSLGAFTTVYVAVIYQLIEISERSQHYGQPAALGFLFGMILYYAILILLSGFYWSTLFAGQKIKENAAMQLDLQRMANEKMAAEKKFLQSQVNPHFLYNTLNFLYAKSLNGPAELSEGIMTLSNIMKYALQKNETSTGFVMLEDEIAHVRNVIQIHQLRFGGKLQINFSVAGDPNQVEVLPFVLITFVENSLKHGDWSDPQSPISIQLFCSEDDQRIFFSVINRKRQGPKERGTGIGLDNVARRLKWAYGSNYSLQCTEDSDIFKAELSVPLYKNRPNA
jgi:sensor histidine kinase YesM